VEMSKSFTSKRLDYLDLPNISSAR
jgi:hypothetical protein